MTVLKRVRQLRGVTAISVARAVCIDQSFYSKLENGKVSASPAVANAIAKHLGNAVTRDQILFPEDYEVDITPKRARSERLQVTTR